MPPDETTPWQLEYRDLFDREDPGNVEKTGVGITEGLVALWHMTLHEGILPDGRRSFSAFSLSWGRNYASVPIPVTDRCPVLAKLRAWVFPAQPEAIPAPDDKRDGCATAPHAFDPNVLRRIAQLHLKLVMNDERDCFYRAADRMLRLCATVENPDELPG